MNENQAGWLDKRISNCFPSTFNIFNERYYTSLVVDLYSYNVYTS